MPGPPPGPGRQRRRETCSASQFSFRLYRFDGAAWSTIPIADPAGEFSPFEALPFRGGLLVRGGTFDPATGRFGTAVHFLEEETVREVPFLRDREVRWAACAESGGRLHCVETAPAADPARPALLHRTEDLATWETLGPVALRPGAAPLSLAALHDRLYLGAGAAGRNGTGERVELYPFAVAAIDHAVLEWDAEAPAGSEVAFQVRSGRRTADLLSRPFVGPDGTPATAFALSGEGLHPSHDGDTLMQALILRTPDAAGRLPIVRWIRISSRSGSVTLAVDDGAGLYAALDEASSAEYVSPVFRLREPVTGGRVFVESLAPAGTWLGIQVRSAGDPIDLLGRPFAGPGGDAGAFYVSQGDPLWPGHDGDRLLQYRAVLHSADPVRAPLLRRVAIETRPGLGGFDLRLLRPAGGGGEPSAWRSGEARPLRVEARDAGDGRAPIRGKASLSARDAGTGEPLRLDPRDVTLHEGRGTVEIRLERARPTEICVRLAGAEGCTGPVDVRPSGAASLAVAAGLPSPFPHWSPAGAAGSPFTLTLAALDRFGNVASDHEGAAACTAWQAGPGEEIARVSFSASDGGVKKVEAAVPHPGEWNVVCADASDPRLAGSLTVVMR